MRQISVRVELTGAVQSKTVLDKTEDLKLDSNVRCTLMDGSQILIPRQLAEAAKYAYNDHKSITIKIQDKK